MHFNEKFVLINNPLFAVKLYFNDKVVTHSAVVEKFCEIRGITHKAGVNKHS